MGRPGNQGSAGLPAVQCRSDRPNGELYPRHGSRCLPGETLTMRSVLSCRGCGDLRIIRQTIPTTDKRFSMCLMCGEIRVLDGSELIHTERLDTPICARLHDAVAAYSLRARVTQERGR